MKNENGITLMALTITIIVMLILSGTVAYSLNSENSALKVKERAEKDYYTTVNKTEANRTSLLQSWGSVVNKTGIDPELTVK